MRSSPSDALALVIGLGFMGFMSLLFTAMVAGAIWWGFYRYRQAQKRRAANVAYAAQRGWHYMQRDPRLTTFAHTAPYGLGRRPSAFEIATGEHRGRWFAIYTYRYWTTSTSSKGGTRSTPHDHTIVAIAAPGSAPVVRLTPEHMGSRIDVALGGVDIEVESREFNRRWRVWTRDERVAHAMLAPHVIDMLLGTEWLGDSIVFEPGRAFIYRTGSATFESSARALDELCDLVDTIPGFVFDAHAGTH